MVVVWGVWEINVWRVDERILKSPAAALEGGRVNGLYSYTLAFFAGKNDEGTDER